MKTIEYMDITVLETVKFKRKCWEYFVVIGSIDVTFEENNRMTESL